VQTVRGGSPELAALATAHLGGSAVRYVRPQPLLASRIPRSGAGGKAGTAAAGALV